MRCALAAGLFRTPWALGAQGGCGWICLAEEYSIVLQHTHLEPTRLYWIAQFTACSLALPARINAHED